MLIRFSFIASLVLVSGIGSAAAAQPHLAGQWDMSLDATNRKCRVTLTAEQAPAGNKIAMPFGCKRALPILSDVERWQGEHEKSLVFADASGKAVLDFQWQDDRRALVSQGPDGEAYHLEPTAGVQLIANKPPALPGFQLAQQAAPAKPAVMDANPMAPVGRYAIIRDAKIPSACVLVLAAGKPSPKGNFKASLEAGCADKGMEIFNPVGWRLEGERLILVAKRGHETSLLPQADGTYAKDKEIKTGKPLLLKKL